MRVQTYPTDQLSVKPSRIRIGNSYMLRNTYGSIEQETMAALLIAMCRELNDQWWGLTLGTFRARVMEEHAKADQGQGSRLFLVRHMDTYNLGIGGLVAQRMLRPERLGDFIVIHPQESLLGPIARYITR